MYIYIYVYMDIIYYSLGTLENTDEKKMLSTWCFEYSGDITCSLLINPSHTDESWAGRNTCMWRYIYIYILITGSNNNIINTYKLMQVSCFRNLQALHVKRKCIHTKK